MNWRLIVPMIGMIFACVGAVSAGICIALDPTWEAIRTNIVLILACGLSFLVCLFSWHVHRSCDEWRPPW